MLFLRQTRTGCSANENGIIVECWIKKRKWEWMYRIKIAVAEKTSLLTNDGHINPCNVIHDGTVTGSILQSQHEPVSCK